MAREAGATRGVRSRGQVQVPVTSAVRRRISMVRSMPSQKSALLVGLVRSAWSSARRVVVASWSITCAGTSGPGRQCMVSSVSAAGVFDDAGGR